MACSSIQSSSSALVKRNIYDVFVSFRGEDTRYNFTDHFFGALRRKCIPAFRDDTKLRKGESIAPELLRAIEGSQVFVVVFSKNYASSTWCLRELEKILECVGVSRKHVLPIFCDVDPSEVRNQRGSYAEAFAKHELKQDLKTVQRWREALTQAANLSGWDLRDKPQYAEIEKIVEQIINILGYKFSSLPNDLVGMHSPIEELDKLLFLDSTDDVRVVGICGMGGLGKTTLATVLYGRIFGQFDACCFIDDVSKIYGHDGAIGVQKQILHQILCEEHLQICNPYNAANLMQRRLCRVRALIILDNVNQAEQLEKLAMNREWLGAGSRVIIISRDEHILKEYGIDGVYKVPLLNGDDSLQLFCRKAFKRDNIMSDYEKVAYDILRYANGLPLAIKVLGSFLFGRDIFEWRSALDRLRESPNKDIMGVLLLSFDGLEEMEKEIFLHIACFFYDEDEGYVKNILNCCGFHPDIGLRVLVDKSLISISWQRIIMHVLLQELGKKLVQENSTTKPRKWSRLWLDEQFGNVIMENMEMNVEAVVLGHHNRKEGTVLMAETLSKMSHLRLLILRLPFSGSLKFLSNDLRYVEWSYYPFKYLPSTFHPNQLVELYLQNGKIKQLWIDNKYLSKLKALNLGGCKNLIKMPDFREFPNLERLNLEGCVKLEHLDPSIGVLRKLVLLNLKDCKNLRSIPTNIFGLSSLKYLNLSGCSKAFNNPNLSSSFKRMIKLPFHPTTHSDLAIASCWLPSLPSFSHLRELNLNFCGLRQIPDAIGCLHWLEGLYLEGNNFVTLPSLRKLSKLVNLNLQHCKQLKSLPELPSPVLPSPVTIQRDHPMFPGIDCDRRAGLFFLDCPELGERERRSNMTLSWMIQLIQELFPGIDNDRRAGLFILNCPELGERERCSNMTFSWMIQFIQANLGSSFPFRAIDIVIPIHGSEIPRWFNNQRVGDSIRMDPSPIMHDENNFIGGVCCVAFSVPPKLSCHWKDEFIELLFECSYEYAFGNTLTLEQHQLWGKSNHMWLIYFPRELFFHMLKDVRRRGDDNINMSARVNQPGGSLDLLEVQVINCGYRWVIKEDLEMMHRGRWLSQECDFLAIEDQAQPQPESII